MASHQGGSEFSLSRRRLSIKHLLITAFLTSAHHQPWLGGWLGGVGGAGGGGGLL